MLGVTNKTLAEVIDIADGLGRKFTGNSYHIYKKYAYLIYIVLNIRDLSVLQAKYRFFWDRYTCFLRVSNKPCNRHMNFNIIYIYNRPRLQYLLTIFLGRNCNHFSEKFVKELLGKDFKFPGWVNRAANLGTMFQCFIPKSFGVQNPQSSEGKLSIFSLSRSARSDSHNLN